jgi:dual-specificity kinase
MSDIEDHFDAEPGKTILGYKVVRKLGTGTFGRVFECQSTAMPSQTAPVARPKHNKKFKCSSSHADRAERARRDEEALLEAE